MAAYENRIKEFRLLNNLKQDELAKKVGVSRVAIGNYERGTRIPSIEIAQQIASVFGVSVSDIFNKTDLSLDIENDLKEIETICSLNDKCFDITTSISILSTGIQLGLKNCRSNEDFTKYTLLTSSIIEILGIMFAQNSTEKSAYRELEQLLDYLEFLHFKEKNKKQDEENNLN